MSNPLAVIIILLALNQSVHAQQKLDIRIVNDEWNASRQSVQKVLESAAAELWQYFPDRSLPPILVTRGSYPVSLYQRGPGGEIQIRLATEETRWSQYAFQFGHEFGHVLCTLRRVDDRNKWFEESLCEAASLFVLRQMSSTWQTDPPHPGWEDYARHLRSYADDRIAQARLPRRMSFVGWYLKEEQSLHKNSMQREKNLIIATRLLMLFEAEPQRWGAIEFLNTEDHPEGEAFADYLSRWHRRCPDEHKPAVREIGKLFQITLPAS